MGMTIATNEKTFVCHGCGETKPIQKEGGTGYGYDTAGLHKYCYACCGKQDTEHMAKGLPICLYLRKNTKVLATAMIYDHNLQIQQADWAWHVTSWPGTIDIPISFIRKGHHNIARVRYDVWFTYAGHNWHGVMYGNDTEIVRCKVVKG